MRRVDVLQEAADDLVAVLITRGCLQSRSCGGRTYNTGDRLLTGTAVEGSSLNTTGQVLDVTDRIPVCRSDKISVASCGCGTHC